MIFAKEPHPSFGLPWRRKDDPGSPARQGPRGSVDCERRHQGDAVRQIERNTRRRGLLTPDRGRGDGGHVDARWAMSRCDAGSKFPARQRL